MYEVSSTCNILGQAEMDNKVGNSGSGKVNKLLSTVDALTKQVNSLKPELPEFKNEKRGDKCSGSKNLCRDYICRTSSHMARRCNTPPSGN